MAASPPEIPTIRTIDTEQAKSCKFIDTVSAAKLGMGASKTMNSARKAAGKKAMKLGANAIVIKSVQSQGAGVMVIVDAFICEDKIVL